MNYDAVRAQLAWLTQAHAALSQRCDKLDVEYDAARRRRVRPKEVKAAVEKAMQALAEALEWMGATGWDSPAGPDTTTTTTTTTGENP